MGTRTVNVVFGFFRGGSGEFLPGAFVILRVFCCESGIGFVIILAVRCFPLGCGGFACAGCGCS